MGSSDLAPQSRLLGDDDDIQAYQAGMINTKIGALPPWGGLRKPGSLDIKLGPQAAFGEIEFFGSQQ